MTNKEFYGDKIFEIACEGHSIAVVNGKPEKCENIQCRQCDFFGKIVCKKLLKEWSEKEHEEPRIQPEVKTLKKDDKVLVSVDGISWVKRYFKKYDFAEESVYAYINGATSWSAGDYNQWKYAKLPEDEPKAKPEINWSKVPVDAKIWVKNSHDPIWLPRYFAEYKHGKVYAWLQGKTSFTTSEEQSWDCAELAKGDK